MMKVLMRRLRWMIVGAAAVFAVDMIWAGGHMTATLRNRLAEAFRTLGGWTQERGGDVAGTMRDFGDQAADTLTTATERADESLRSTANEVDADSAAKAS